MDTWCRLADLVHEVSIPTASFVNDVDLTKPYWGLPVTVIDGEFEIPHCWSESDSSTGRTLQWLLDRHLAGAEMGEGTVDYGVDCDGHADVHSGRAQYFSFAVREVGRGDVDGDGLQDIVVEWWSGAGGTRTSHDFSWLTRRTRNEELEAHLWNH
jgi:hypothetical protein